jgi:transposase
VTLVEATLERCATRDLPVHLIGDKAYDSDGLDESMRDYGVDMIAPHRDGRTSAPTQDGRKLRRYRRRFKVERLFAWLQNFRRVATRWEYHAENYQGFVTLGCIVILLRHF